MEITNTSLYREIETIIKSSSKPVHFNWTAELHANGETYKALKVISVDSLEDYELNYSDEIIVKLAISGGTYSKRIYPYKSKLDITIYKKPIGETSDTYDTESTIETERFTATILDTGNPMVEGNGSNTASEEALNLTNIFEVSFQLVNKALEQMRMASVGGIYRNTTTENVLKTVLTNESKNIKVESGRLPLGVEMVEASNKEVRNHVIIPQGTRLVTIPEYLQFKCGGVYSGGLGYYYKQDHWYVFPCYDTTKFNKAKRTLTIINVPRNKFPDIERTYRKDGNNLVIMATGEVRLKDDSEEQQLNNGNGVRFADASTFMDDFSSTSNNKTKVNRGSNNTELVAEERSTGINNVVLSNNPITSNPFVEYSKLARRQGSFLSLTWENSLPSLIEPGMKTRIYYIDGEDIRDVYGIVIKAHHYVSNKGVGMTDVRHITRTALVVFVQRITN